MEGVDMPTGETPDDVPGGLDFRVRPESRLFLAQVLAEIRSGVMNRASSLSPEAPLAIFFDVRWEARQ